MKMVINSNMQHNGLILVLANTISKSTLFLETEKDVNTVFSYYEDGRDIKIIFQSMNEIS